MNLIATIASSSNNAKIFAIDKMMTTHISLSHRARIAWMRIPHSEVDAEPSQFWGRGRQLLFVLLTLRVFPLAVEMMISERNRIVHSEHTAVLSKLSPLSDSVVVLALC